MQKGRCRKKCGCHSKISSVRSAERALPLRTAPRPAAAQLCLVRKEAAGAARGQKLGRARGGAGRGQPQRPGPAPGGSRGACHGAFFLSFCHSQHSRQGLGENFLLFFFFFCWNGTFSRLT